MIEVMDSVRNIALTLVVVVAFGMLLPVLVIGGLASIGKNNATKARDYSAEAKDSVYFGHTKAERFLQAYGNQIRCMECKTRPREMFSLHCTECKVKVGDTR